MAGDPGPSLQAFCQVSSTVCWLSHLNIHVIGNKKHMEENSSIACIEGGFLHEV